MRIEPPPQSRIGTALGALAVLVSAALGALVASALGALVGAVLSLASARAVSWHGRRRYARRARVVARPIPEGWRQLLLDRYDHYERLPTDLRRRFEDDVRLFVDEKRITGVGVHVTEELRLLVAASAVTLSVAWPDYEWNQLSEVLLYPDDFDRDYQIGRSELAGQAHGWGTLILSVPALIEGFEDPDEACHVGLHEFAHLLDVEGTQFDGLPSGFDDAHARRFIALREKEMERLRRGKSVLDEYGANDPVEFFPVAVEAFFEPALALRKRHRELYELLSEYFRQDPAAWDDARGLVL
jgi:Mlc titration factor MtfA (ptsG expression regulator)